MSGFCIYFARLERLDQMECKIIAFIHSVLFCHFSCHGKFQISCFRGTAKTGNQQFFISLIWIGDVVQSFFVRYFNGEDLNIRHSSFTISFSSFISSGYRSPVVFTFFAIWLIFIPILCISSYCFFSGVVSVLTI